VICAILFFCFVFLQRLFFLKRNYIFFTKDANCTMHIQCHTSNIKIKNYYVQLQYNEAFSLKAVRIIKENNHGRVVELAAFI